MGPNRKSLIRAIQGFANLGRPRSLVRNPRFGEFCELDIPSRSRLHDEDEGEVCQGPYAGRGYYLMQLLRGGIVTVQGYLTHKKRPTPGPYRRPVPRVLGGS